MSDMGERGAAAARSARATELPRLVVVTGLSGAGKTTSLHALADAGYYCVDNLPPTLASATVRVLRSGGIGRVALGMDVRVGAFLDAATEAVEALQHDPGGLTVLFLDATDESLVRRFSETRRPHPMLADEDGPEGVLDGVRKERDRLGSIRSVATLVVDTSHMTVHDLRRHVLDQFAPEAERPHMHTRVMSFGFKHGAPLDADVMLDVRFLDNPHFEAELRDKGGDDPQVQSFVLGSPGCAELLDHVERLLSFSVPRYEREGKSYLTVAIGCTGGRHRSVVVASELARRLSAATRRRVGIVHRDLARGATVGEVLVEETPGRRRHAGEAGSRRGGVS